MMLSPRCFLLFSAIRTVGCLVLCLFFANPAWATRWTLVDFGANSSQTVTPYSGWNTPLVDPVNGQYFDPDGNPDHAGVAEIDGVTEEAAPYFGVSGTSPIVMEVGMKIIVTFYNRVDWEEYIIGRVSLSDPDGPDPADETRPWYTLGVPSYDPVDTGAVYIPVPGHSLIEMEFYIADATSVTAPGVPVSTGDCTVINVNKPGNSNAFVLTKIELSDEADRTPPVAPTGLSAQLISHTTGSGTNLVELTWNPATDAGTGVSHYLIYRNGELYDTLSSDLTGYLGDSPRYVDLAVAPETIYNYYVTALDRALSGMYPSPWRPESRRGNESDPSNTAMLTTPGWASSTLINPYVDLDYQGIIRLPYSVEEPFAYAGAGLAYSPSGNPAPAVGELEGSLYIYTQNASEVAEISIPSPGLASECESWPEARVLNGPADLWPAVYDGETIPDGGGWGEAGRAAGLAFHPAAGSLEEMLYYGVCNFYATDATAPAMGAFSLALDSAHGAWHVGGTPPLNIHPALAAKIIFPVEMSWAATNTGGRSLIIGNTYLSGHGGVNGQGPSLYAVAPWESSSLPPNGGSVSAVELLKYSVSPTLENRMVGWHADEFGEGGAWLQGSGHSAVALSHRYAIGDVWYGDLSGGHLYEANIPSAEEIDRGVGATEWRTGIMFYAPRDLAEVAAGRLESYEPQPYVVFDLHGFSQRPDGGDGMAGAITFDSASGLLFYIEHNGDPCHEDGYSLLHVWQLKEIENFTGTYWAIW
jgi:hypothetical protein